MIFMIDLVISESTSLYLSLLPHPPQRFPYLVLLLCLNALIESLIPTVTLGRAGMQQAPLILDQRLRSALLR